MNYLIYAVCNIGMSDLPHMYAQSLRAIGQGMKDIYIREITSVYVTINIKTMPSGELKEARNLRVKTTEIYREGY